MTIAITGATGQLGRIVVDKLKRKISPSEIVALVRSPEKARDLGVELRVADYMQPDALEAALKNIDTLLLISSNEFGQRAEQHANVIAAAKQAGVKRIVYTSVLHADTSKLNLAVEHIQTESDLKTSGVAFTILRNGWYTENYTNAIGSALSNGAFYGSAGNGKIASAPRADYAEAAVVVLTGSGHEGKTYELAGDEAYTLTDLAAEVSRQSAKSIPYIDLPAADYARALQQAGVPEDFAAAIASWDVAASEGALFDGSHQLSHLTGRPTTGLAAVVGAALKI